MDRDSAQGIDQYVEPLSTFVRRKYLELSLAFLPLVATGVLDWAFLQGGTPPLWAVVYANALALVLPGALLIAFRNRLERSRFRISEGSIELPSLVRIDGTKVESLPLSSVVDVGSVRGEIGILGFHTETDVEAEIKIRYKGEDMVLVWPIGAFGRRNLEALARAVSGVRGPG